MPFDPFKHVSEFDEEQNEAPYEEPITPGQRRASRAADTEIRRNMQKLAPVMDDKVLKAELEEPNRAIDRWSITSLTGDLFEVLGTGNFTVAGMASELASGGNVWEAVKRGSAELMTALPLDSIGVDKEFAESVTGKKVKQESWYDVLKKFDFKPFDNENHNNWAIAGAGFVLDIATDPLTYLGGLSLVRGGGMAFKGGLLEKIAGDARRFEGLAEVGDMVRGTNKLRAGKGEDEFNSIQSVVNAINKGFNPDAYLDDWARVNRNSKEFDVEREVTRFKTMIEEIKGGTEQKRIEIIDAASSIFGHMNPDERALVNLYAGNPAGRDHFVGIVDELAAGDEALKDRLLGSYDAIASLTDDWAQEAQKAGIMSPLHLKEQYWAHRFPERDGLSFKTFEKVLKRFGIPESRIKKEYYSGAVTDGVSVKESAFHKAQKYDDNELRILSGVPTELDLGVTWAKRSLEQAQEIVTKNAIESWISQTDIVRPLLPDDSLFKVIKKNSTDAGYSFKNVEDVMKDNKGLTRKKAEKMIKDGEVDPLKTVDELMAENPDMTRKQAQDVINDAVENLRKLDEAGYELTDFTFSRTGFDMPSREMGTIRNLNQGERFYHNKSLYKVLGKDKNGDATVARVDGKVDEFLNNQKSLTIDRNMKVVPVERPPMYIIPKEFSKHYNKANEVLTNNPTMEKLISGVKRVTAPWKGWALVSPGYHARNVYSNVFMNYLGLGSDALNPKHSFDSFRLLEKSKDRMGFGDVNNIKIKMKNGETLEGLDIIKKFDSLNGRGVTMVDEDIPKEIEAELMRLFRKSDRRSKGNQRQLADLVDNPSNYSSENLGKVLKNIDGEDIGANRREFLSVLLREATDQARGKRVKDVLFDESLLKSEKVKEMFNSKEIMWLRTHMGTENFVLEMNRKFGRFLEDNAKLTHFITKMRQGASPEEAMWSVKKYLFDYADLTTFERDVMKQVIPFYTWMRKNIPLQFQAIMNNPGRYAAITGKPVTAIESVKDEWSTTPEPDYFEEINTVRMPKAFSKQWEVWDTKVDDQLRGMGYDVDDLQEGVQPVPQGGAQPMSLGVSLPYEDLNRALSLSSWVESLNPIAKITVETIAEPEKGSQISLFGGFGKERYKDEPSQTDYLGLIPGVSKKTQRIISDLVPPAGRTQRLIEKAGRGDLALGLASELTGIRVIKKDIGKLNRGKKFKTRDKLRAIARKYKALGKIK